MKTLIRLIWEALFLSNSPYAKVREDPSPALRGLAFLLLIALSVALLGLVGTTLEWATTPELGEIQAIVLEGIQEMDWYQDLQREPDFREQFQRWYDMGWRIFPYVFDAPSIPRAALRIILLPLRLVLVWLAYGLLAHLVARMLGGEGNLGQTMGCTALALAPQLLSIATLVPYLVVGGVVTTWTLLCRYVALKTCHRLSWDRTLAATVLPTVVFVVIISFFGCLASAVLGTIYAGGASQ